MFGRSASRIRRGEDRLAGAADLIVASNPVVADAWRERGRADTLLIPFGCDAERFAASDQAPPAEDVHLTPPVAGFVGHLGDRIDLRLIEAVADKGVSLLLVGPRHPRFELKRMDELLARKNVQWVGAKPFEALPSYLRAIDVGLVPYADSAFNRGSFPLKTLEYLAVGRGFVARDLPAIRWLVDQGGRTCRAPHRGRLGAGDLRGSRRAYAHPKGGRRGAPPGLCGRAQLGQAGRGVRSGTGRETWPVRRIPDPDMTGPEID